MSAQLCLHFLNASLYALNNSWSHIATTVLLKVKNVILKLCLFIDFIIMVEDMDALVELRKIPKDVIMFTFIVL